jgi:hypothetical protein
MKLLFRILKFTAPDQFHSYKSIPENQTIYTGLQIKKSEVFSADLILRNF